MKWKVDNCDKKSEVQIHSFLFGFLRNEIDIMMSNKGREMMGIHIRRAIEDDIQGIAKVHVDSWKTTYKGIFADEILDNIAYEKREKQWEDIFQKKVIIDLDL